MEGMRGTEENVSKINVLKLLHVRNKTSHSQKKNDLLSGSAFLLLWFGYLVAEVRYESSDMLFKGY